MNGQDEALDVNTLLWKMSPFDCVQLLESCTMFNRWLPLVWLLLFLRDLYILNNILSNKKMWTDSTVGLKIFLNPFKLSIVMIETLKGNIGIMSFGNFL